MMACTTLYAQSFKNRAALDPVTKTGFYSIPVTPELSSYVKTDFSDLRIMDDSGRQVPYIIESFNIPLSTQDIIFHQLNIISKRQDDSGKTILIIDNSENEKINSVTLLIANVSVIRSADMSGSNDNQNWFSILENIALEKKNIQDTDEYAETINFPLVSYHYIKLVIDNKKYDPLNIIAAGNYKEVRLKENMSYVQNSPCSFTQQDNTDGYSYINIHSLREDQVSRIVLYVSGPKFFKRDIEVAIPYSLVTKFTLSSDTVFNLNIPVIKARDWLIKIYNGDNPALKIKSITTFQQFKTIVPWLDSARTYHLEMNDLNAKAPEYDLQAFKDSLPRDIPRISFSNIEAMPATNAVTASTSFFKRSWLWAVIIVILVGLLFFTWKLTREVGKKV